MWLLSCTNNLCWIELLILSSKLYDPDTVSDILIDWTMIFATLMYYDVGFCIKWIAKDDILKPCLTRMNAKIS